MQEAGFNTKNKCFCHQNIKEWEKQLLKITSPRSAEENRSLELIYYGSADQICDMKP